MKELGMRSRTVGGWETRGVVSHLRENLWNIFVVLVGSRTTPYNVLMLMRRRVIMEAKSK